MCNSMLLGFDLIGDWLEWQIGNGRKVRIGQDPWIGGGGIHKIDKSSWWRI